MPGDDHVIEAALAEFKRLTMTAFSPSGRAVADRAFKTVAKQLLDGGFNKATEATTIHRCPHDGYVLNPDGSCTGCLIETL